MVSGMMVRSVVVSLCFALSACVSVRPIASAPSHEGWPLLAPATLGETRTANQILRVAHGDQETTLNCVVSVSAEQLSIVGVTALGLRAFTVKFDGATVTAEALPGVPQSMAPERLLNDAQLAYWPLAALKKAMADSPWEVSEPAPGTRRLRRGGKLIAEVHYAQRADSPWLDRVWLTNLEFGYTLAIDSKTMASGAQ